MAGIIGDPTYQNIAELVLKLLDTIFQFHFSYLELENSKFQLLPFDVFLAYIIGSTQDFPPLLPE